MLYDWQSAHNTPCVQPRHGGVLKQTKPTAGRFQCNIDASFFQHTIKVGIGVCIIDDPYTFVLATAERLTPVYDVNIGTGWHGSVRNEN